MKPAFKPLAIPGTPIVLNGVTRYGISRNVPARDAQGFPAKIALVVLERDNGSIATLAISEDLIKFAGEGIIEDEIKAFAAK